MDLVIEDGTARSDSNSYATVADLRAYAQLRGATVPTKDTDCEVLLIKAMDKMESARDHYQGMLTKRTQALALPRSGMYIDNWPVLSTEIPRQAIQAQCAFAIEAQTTDLLPTTAANSSGPVTNKTVGDISISYANPGSVRRTPAVAKAEVLFRTLLKNNGLIAVRT